MEQLKKSFFIIMLIGMLCINILFMTQNFLKQTFDIAIRFSILLNIPLLIAFIFFLTRFHRSAKLMINYFFLLCSFLCFAFVLLDMYLYYSVPTYNYSSFFIEPILLFGFLFVLFLLLAYRKNFKGFFTSVIPFTYTLITFAILVTVELSFLLPASIVISGFKITNPDRYEFVKVHYFTSEDLASFPDKIPEDATNIIFFYTYDFLKHSYKSLTLEYDSNTLTSDNHHASFYVKVDQ